VPAYQYPGGALWEGLAALGPGSLVIVDPADGPGERADPTYVAALSALRRPGLDLFGYVTADYGRRSAAQMIDEVQRHERWYQPTGVFVDQTPPAATARPELAATFAYVRSRGLRLAINPGQPDIEPDDVHACDHVVNFEGPLAAYRRARFPVWTTELGPEKFWHLVYEVPDRSSLRTVVAEARRRAAVVLVTDATMPNPWGRLPAYWPEEVRLVTGRRARRPPGRRRAPPP